MHYNNIELVYPKNNNQKKNPLAHHNSSCTYDITILHVYPNDFQKLFKEKAFNNATFT